MENRKNEKRAFQREELSKVKGDIKCKEDFYNAISFVEITENKVIFYIYSFHVRKTAAVVYHRVNIAGIRYFNLVSLDSLYDYTVNENSRFLTYEVIDSKLEGWCIKKSKAIEHKLIYDEVLVDFLTLKNTVPKVKMLKENVRNIEDKDFKLFHDMKFKITENKFILLFDGVFLNEIYKTIEKRSSSLEDKKLSLKGVKTYYKEYNSDEIQESMVFEFLYRKRYRIFIKYSSFDAIRYLILKVHKIKVDTSLLEKEYSDFFYEVYQKSLEYDSMEEFKERYISHKYLTDCENIEVIVNVNVVPQIRIYDIESNREIAQEKILNIL